MSRITLSSTSKIYKDKPVHTGDQHTQYKRGKLPYAIIAASIFGGSRGREWEHIPLAWDRGFLFDVNAEL